MARIMRNRKRGLRCIGVPVFDRFGVVIAGLSISFPTATFLEERLHEYVAMLHQAARKISGTKWDTTTIRSEAADNGYGDRGLRRDRRFDVSRYQPRLCFYAAEGNC